MANPNPSNPMKPGETRNPNGRPKKGYSITEMMKEMLSEHPDRKKEIGEVIYQKAKEGDMAAISKVWSYMDGMPKQNLEIEGKVEHNVVTTPTEYTLDSPRGKTNRSVKKG